MLSLWTNSYSKFVIKILKQIFLSHNHCYLIIKILNQEFTTVNIFVSFTLSILLPNLSWQIYPNLNFLCCISSFEGNSYRNCKIQSLVLYFLIVLHELLHLQISIFTIFQNLTQHYLKKDFCQFFLFNRFTQTPTPLKVKIC